MLGCFYLVDEPWVTAHIITNVAPFDLGEESVDVLLVELGADLDDDREGGSPAWLLLVHRIHLYLETGDFDLLPLQVPGNVESAA